VAIKMQSIATWRLCVAVVIWASLVNTRTETLRQTDRQLLAGYTSSSAS